MFLEGFGGGLEGEGGGVFLGVLCGVCFVFLGVLGFFGCTWFFFFEGMSSECFMIATTNQKN